MVKTAGEEGIFDVHLEGRERVRQTKKEAKGRSLHKGSETWKGLKSWRNWEKLNGTGTVSEGQTCGR